MNDITYYCPKCQSEDIEFFEINKPKTPRVSIDEIGQTHLANLVLITRKYRVKCKDCEYTVEYER